MKKRIRILILALIAVLSLCFALAGCKVTGDGDDDDTFGDGEGKTIVKFYSFNNETQNKALKAALAEDFYKKNPDIYVKTELSTGYFYTNLLNSFTGGVEADVFRMEPGEIYPFLQGNYLEPLDSYFEKSEKVSLDDIWDVNKAAYAYDYETGNFGSGSTYSIMQDWSTDSMLMYNRKLFSAEQLSLIEKDADGDGKPDPLTFAQFEQLCRELLVKSGKRITQYSFLPGLSESKVLMQFLTNAGLSWFNPDTLYSTLTNAAEKEVVKYYYDILGMNEANDTGGTTYPMFARGEVAMVMGGLYCVDAYNLASSSFDLGVAYPPVKDATYECKPYTTGCVGFGISSRSKVKDAAFKFIEWYLEYYGKQDSSKCYNFPAIKSYVDEYMLNPDVNPNVKLRNLANAFSKSLDDAVIIDRNPGCSIMSFESTEFLYAGEYLQGVRGIDEFCQIISTDVNKKVDAYKQLIK